MGENRITKSYPQYLQILLHYQLIGGRVFTNGLGDRGSIPGWVIPKLKKWYLITPCLTLSIIRNVSRVKWSNPGKGVASHPTPQYSSFWKGSLRVIFDYSCQLFYLILIYYLQYFTSNITVFWNPSSHNLNNDHKHNFHCFFFLSF